MWLLADGPNIVLDAIMYSLTGSDTEKNISHFQDLQFKHKLSAMNFTLLFLLEEALLILFEDTHWREKVSL